jgi:hypothetical protein
MLKSVMSQFRISSSQVIADPSGALLTSSQPRRNSHASSQIAEALIDHDVVVGMRAAVALEKLPRHITKHVARPQRSCVDTSRKYCRRSHCPLRSGYSSRTRSRIAIRTAAQSGASPLCKLSQILAQQDRTFRKQALQHARAVLASTTAAGRPDAQAGKGLREPTRVGQEIHSGAKCVFLAV